MADRIEAHVADLMSRPRGFALEPGAWDLVCDFYFLDRSLFDEIRAAVRPLVEGASREHGHERGTAHLVARRPG